MAWLGLAWISFVRSARAYGGEGEGPAVDDVRMVDEHNGRFHFEPTGSDPVAIGSDYWSNGLRWQFVGYYSYRAESPYAYTTPPHFELEDAPLSRWASFLDDTSPAFDLQRLDRFGRQWIVVEVDPAAVRAAQEEISQRGLDEELAQVGGTPQVELDATYEFGAAVVDPDAYVVEVCNHWRDGNQSIDVGVWDGESRVQQSTPYDSVEKPNVTVVYTRDGTWRSSCSGTLVDNDTVLTAAHCVVDTFDDPFPTSWLAVCFNASPTSSGSCSTIDSVIVNPDYAGSTNDDWAVLKVPTWLTTNVTPTGLSQLNQDTHIQHDAFRRGYPWMAATFGDTSGFCFDFEYPVETGCPSDWVPCQGMFHQTGEVTGFTTNRINTKLDSSDGDSGSSFQYLPATPKVTGLNVAKYYLAGGWRAGGPKVEIFRTFVQSQY